MKARILIIMSVAFCSVAICHAQKIDRSRERSSMDEFVNSIRQDFDNFRQESLAEFAEFLRDPWKEFKGCDPIPEPKPEPVPPVIWDENSCPIKNKPIIIDEEIGPVITEPKPQPVEPIEEVPVVNPKYVDVTYFGTTDKVRLDTSSLPRLRSVSEESVANMVEALSTDEIENLIFDCLTIRDKRKLSDWAYLQLLNKVSEEAYPDKFSESQVFLGYIFMMSGYKMRFATDGANIYMLYASEHRLYNVLYYRSEGNDLLYSLTQLPSNLRISSASYPYERSLSLLISTSQDFEQNRSTPRVITSKRYPDISIEVDVNKNLLDFYSTYPSSEVNGNMMTRWAMYANTPMESQIASKLYPYFKDIFKGKTELEAVSILLNMVQTGFQYGYDDEIWGHDRAFFAEETFYYPKCDCEDRSILFTRLVRDVLGLNCILIYYPGHLAAAVEFSDEVEGDYIVLNGKKYTITDPTYIGAPIGATMPKMDNATAKAILLN